MITQTRRKITRKTSIRMNRAPANPLTVRLDRWFKRNAIGEQKEGEGKFEEAIRLYEANVGEDADTLFPYERLAILYKRKRDEGRELRIIKKAIQKLKDKARRKPLDSYMEKQLDAFSRRLMEITGEDANEVVMPKRRALRLI